MDKPCSFRPVGWLWSERAGRDVNGNKRQRSQGGKKEKEY